MKLADLIAEPMRAPREWQSKAPDSMFEHGMPIRETPDLQRILSLPRRPQLDLGSQEAQILVDHEMSRYGRGDRRCGCKSIDPKRECIRRMMPVQGLVMHEARMHGGVIGSIPVGFGKSFLDIMVIQALAGRGVTKGLLLIPPSLVDQICIDYMMIGEHFNVPSIVVERGKSQKPFQRTVIGQPMLRVLPYSRLSSPDSSAWIEQLSPHVIIADECDALKSLLSARTMRVFRYFYGHPNMTSEQRAIRARAILCAWTGSLTNQSIKEMAGLSAIALRERSPMPLDPMVVEEWSRCLDASDFPSPPGALLALCAPGEDVREAFRRRLAETPGFIVVSGSTHVARTVITGGEVRAGANVEIEITERVAPAIPDIIQLALDKVRKFERPDTLLGSKYDEELVTALDQAKVASEVSVGIMNHWIYPREEEDALIDRWFEKRKRYFKELRHKIMRGEEHLDSPKLCEDAAKRAWGDLPKNPKLPEWKSAHWPAWRDIRDQVQPKSVTKRLHSFIVDDAIEWGAKNKGIIWYTSVELAKWMEEKSGFTVHGGGPDAGERLRLDPGDRTIIASLRSHGRGRDGLQHSFNEQLITQVMSSDTGFEQLIGRLHRRGQKEAVVRTYVYLHTTEVRASFDQALRRAEYVKQVLGSERKLLVGFGEG